MPQDKHYFVRVESRIQGPFTAKQLRTLVAKGQLKTVHEVSADKKRWVKAESVVGLFGKHVEPSEKLDLFSVADDEIEYEPSQELGSLPILIIGSLAAAIVGVPATIFGITLGLIVGTAAIGLFLHVLEPSLVLPVLVPFSCLLGGIFGGSGTWTGSEIASDSLKKPKSRRWNCFGRCIGYLLCNWVLFLGVVGQ